MKRGVGVREGRGREICRGGGMGRVVKGVGRGREYRGPGVDEVVGREIGKSEGERKRD